MFGLDKLMAMKKQAEEIKERLNNISVEGEAGNEKIRVVSNGNRKITAVRIDENWMRTAAIQEIEDYMEEACNKALEKAEKLSESEMKSMLPGLGGLGL